MIKVSQKCKTLEEGIKFMMAGAKADYVRMSTNNGLKELTGYSLEQTGKWDSNTRIINGIHMPISGRIQGIVKWVELLHSSRRGN